MFLVNSVVSIISYPPLVDIIAGVLLLPQINRNLVDYVNDYPKSPNTYFYKCNFKSDWQIPNLNDCILLKIFVLDVEYNYNDDDFDFFFYGNFPYLQDFQEHYYSSKEELDRNSSQYNHHLHVLNQQIKSMILNKLTK